MMGNNNIFLRCAHLAPDIWKKLGEIPRTGWVKRGVKNPETVQEHTIALMTIAKDFPSLSSGFSPEQKADLIDMLEIHDWPEAIVGDEVVVTNDKDEKEKLLDDKFKRERRAMSRICWKLCDSGQDIFDLWIRFEKSPDQASFLARQLDKYQAIQKALEFELAQGIMLFEEFRDYARPFITNPLILQKIEELNRIKANKGLAIS